MRNNLPQNIFNLSADLAYRIQRSTGILKNHRRFTPANSGKIAFARLEQIEAADLKSEDILDQDIVTESNRQK